MGGPVIVHPLFRHTVDAQPEPRAFWEQVPDEVLHRIALFLDDGACLARLRRVNRRCRALVDDKAEDVWRSLCVRRFNADPTMTPEPSSWAAVYAFNARALYDLFVQQTADAVRAAMARALGNSVAARIRLPGLNFAAA